MYEPPNRANCEHNICSTLCFEYLLSACTGAVKLSPFFFDILLFFGFNEKNSAGMQSTAYPYQNLYIHKLCAGMLLQIMKVNKLCL